MRLGIVGTSHWARHVHGATAGAHPDWDLVAVWALMSGTVTAA